MHRQPGYVVAACLDFACVQTGAYLDAEFGSNAIGQRPCAADRTGRAVKRREQTVAGALDPTAAAYSDFDVAQVVVAVQQIPPRRVADSPSSHCGVDDV